MPVEILLFILCCIIFLLGVVLRPSDLLSAFIINLPMIATGVIGAFYFAKKLGFL